VPSEPALSPDGQRVVYEVPRTSWKDDAFERDLWIADRAGSTHLLTSQVSRVLARGGRRMDGRLRLCRTVRGRLRIRRRTASAVFSGWERGGICNCRWRSVLFNANQKIAVVPVTGVSHA